MHSLAYRIILKSPLVITTMSGDRNMIQTRKFIPGTVVLGILAERFIKKQESNFNSKLAHQNEAFYNWFLFGKLKISNAYICSKDEYGNHVYYPSPFSLEKEKYGKATYDFLFHKEVDSTSGIDDFCFFSEGKIETKSVKVSINFHHARDPEKGSSKEGMIFNYESISSSQTFEGKLFGNKHDLKDLLSICGNKWDTIIGRSRTAEYGRVEFLIVDEDVVLEENQVIWPKEEEKDDDDDDDDRRPEPAKYISMTLLSNLILYNEYGYPTIEVDDLCNELKKFISNITIKKSFVKVTEIENFVGVWQLKKPSETCFAAGSSFLLDIEKSEINIKQLTEIQQNGIGERTHEGFGRCVFGLQTKSKPFLEEESEKETNSYIVKPEENIPNIAREIISKIIKEDIFRKMELKAIEEQQYFHPFLENNQKIEEKALKAIEEQQYFHSLPPNALIAKLETIVKNCNNRIEFVEKISNLRKIALEHLERCNSQKWNLLEFLAGFRINEERIKHLSKEEIIDPQIYNTLQLLKKQRILIKDLEKEIKRKLNISEKLVLLKYIEFCENPTDLELFFTDRNNTSLKLLCEEINIYPEKDEKLKDELFKTYFVTFFLMMRKRANAEKGGVS